MTDVQGQLSVEQPFRSLLVPIDLSPASDRVVARVTRLPLAADAHVRLLHVVPSSLTEVARMRALADAARVIDDEVKALARKVSKGVSIEPVVLTGAAATEIATSATEMDAELIVMGRGGGRAVRDMFLGSTAERVVRRTRIPVLVVRLPARNAYARPALALDVDEAVHEIVPLFFRLIRPNSPVVTVIHAFDLAYRERIYESLTEEDAEACKQEYRRHFMQQMSDRLAAALVRAKVPMERAPTWNLHVRYGAPRTVIATAVKNEDIDLLVLGTHGHTGLSHAFLGTVAGDVLREVTCDVLVVPPSALDESDHRINDALKVY